MAHIASADASFERDEDSQVELGSKRDCKVIYQDNVEELTLSPSKSRIEKQQMETRGSTEVKNNFNQSFNTDKADTSRNRRNTGRSQFSKHLSYDVPDYGLTMSP